MSYSEGVLRLVDRSMAMASKSGDIGRGAEGSGLRSTGGLRGLLVFMVLLSGL